MQTLQLKQQATRLTNQQRIIKLLGWDEMQYSQFVYDTGLRYLELYIPTDHAGIDALSRSKIFWAWWRNHWAARDAKFMAPGPEGERNEIYYKWYHSPHRLTNEIFPNAVVLGESYAVMIDHFNKSVV